MNVFVMKVALEAKLIIYSHSYDLVEASHAYNWKLNNSFLESILTLSTHKHSSLTEEVQMFFCYLYVALNKNIIKKY